MTTPPEDFPPEAIAAAMDALQGAKLLYGNVWAKRVTMTVLEAAAPHLAAAERTALCETLTGHYLAAITCDHERKQDRPECACSLVDLGWHPSVGEAVQAWIRHVMWRRSADLATEQP